MANYIKLKDQNRLVFNDTDDIFVPIGTAAFRTHHKETSFPIYDCTAGATYDEWFRNYAANGANYLRVRLPHASAVNNDVTRGFQSAPLDWFDIADNVPTMYGDLANPDLSTWDTKVANSNITAMIDAAETHGIYIGFIFFYEILLKSGTATWVRNPYYRPTRYAFDGSLVPDEHKGTIDSELDYFIPEADLIRDYSAVSNPWDERGVTRGDALAEADRNYITGYYQQRYLKTFIDNWGDSLNIAHWETMCEVQWVGERESGADKLAAAELYVPWCKAVKSYIQSIDPYSDRAVIHSDVRFNASGNYDFYVLKEGDDTKVRLIKKDLSEEELNYADQSDYNKFRATHNSLFYDSDFIQWHNYALYDLDTRRDVVRMLQEAFPNRPYINGEYWSEYWEAPEQYQYIYPPYKRDRQQMWIDFVVTGGVGTANRMSGKAREDNSSDPTVFDWTELDPDWYTIFCKPLGKFMVSTGFNTVEWNNNFGLMYKADDNVDGDINFAASQSNGNQVLAIIQGSADNITVTIDDLVAGFYESRLYDYLTGNLIDTDYAQIIGTQLTLSLDVSDANLDNDGDGYGRDRIAILYIKNRTNVPHTVVVVDVN